MKEIVVLNIISLAKTKEDMAQKNSATNYDNHHLTVNNIVVVLKLILLLVKNSSFKNNLAKSVKRRY